MADAMLPAALSKRYSLLNTMDASGVGRLYAGYDRIKKEKVVIAHYERNCFHVSSKAIHLLKDFKHRNLAAIIDTNQDHGWVWIIQEYIYGQKLSELIKCEEEDYRSKLIRWFEEIVDAVMYLHSQRPYGFVHGDIKPENIMIDHNGIPILIDFCCLKQLSSELKFLNLRATRAYASEEVVNYGRYGFQSDKYSLDRLKSLIMEQKK